MLEVDPVEQPTRPKCGCPAESPQGVPILAGDRLQRLTELEHRISKGSVPRGGQSCAFRDYQHFDWLAGLKWKALQNDLAMLADCSFSPVCLHGLIIEDSITRLSRGAGFAPVRPELGCRNPAGARWFRARTAFPGTDLSKPLKEGARARNAFDCWKDSRRTSPASWKVPAHPTSSCRGPIPPLAL